MTRSYATDRPAQHVWHITYSSKSGQPLVPVADAHLQAESLHLEVLALRLLYAQQRERIAQLEAQLQARSSGSISLTSPQ
ncbi:MULTISPECIES: hypothetical protein [unclassified Variovorax]|uniref:hypothetical protein n=1 Tax=unclassified Variovorax TaxID=663243 RepID=UPI0008393C6C|nr:MULTISPECIES: hypothetical protein [unclassified Variovorax]PNG49895.1 hypothetical protein CHC06_05476 [Variovorax sp. B2]PNG50767.1 hypothetical protein CHC07_05381 [Variovorax sp. B4]VTU42122.1 hypothetical protein H6P1_00113 [Variovorax sp. PBL-H6]VTU44234.1 hypothetical protein SRS16P1_00789 [Variovorax sp. SRS16]VTU44309.1 hypothetical protein E5P1_00782 [Variovorax sp. PBL-E5]